MVEAPTGIQQSTPARACGLRHYNSGVRENWEAPKRVFPFGARRSVSACSQDMVSVEKGKRRHLAASPSGQSVTALSIKVKQLEQVADRRTVQGNIGVER